MAAYFKSTKMKQLLQEAIAALEHSKVFISSRQKMHECGQNSHQECIDKLSQEVERMYEIERIKDALESKHTALIDENEKNIGEDCTSLKKLIN